MVMRKLFGRKKKGDGEEPETEMTDEPMIEAQEAEEDEVKKTAAAPATEPVAVTPTEPVSTEEAPTEQESEPIAGTIPYHSRLIDRLLYMFNDKATSSAIAGPDEFVIEFMAVGERFWIRKPANGQIQNGSGAIPDEDVYIRVSDSVVQQLLSAATFDEFSSIYLKYYKAPEAGSFVKVELRKDISSLNRMGYARVPLLKLLIGVKR